MLKRALSSLFAFAIIINCSIFTKAYAAERPIPELTSETAVLMDASTGQVLFEKQMNQKMYPASITKIMTALVALEKGNLNDIITMSENAVFSIPRDSSHIALDVGEQLTLEQALYAMLVESANDAANGIAEHIGGSIDKFVEMMNAKAQKLGAVNTHFANPHGLHSENHYTTAYDMAIITRAALNNEMFSKIAGTVKYTIPPTNKQPQERYLNNRNYLLNPSYKYDGAYCGKNGWTMQAKYTLVTCARKNERNLIAVVMKANTSDNSFFDSIRLFDYGFDQFKTVTIPKEKISVPAFNVTDSSNRIYQVNAFSDNNFTFLVYNAFNAENISVEIEYPPQKTLEALNDLKARFTVSADNKYMYSVLGEYKLTANAEKISEISVSDNNSNINKQNKLKQAIVLIFKILLYLFIFIIIIFIILLIIRYINLSRRKRRRRR